MNIITTKKIKGQAYKFYKDSIIYNNKESYFLKVITPGNMYGYSNTIIFNSLIDYTQLHRIESITTLKKIRSIIVNDIDLLRLVLEPILDQKIVYQLSIGIKSLEII